MLRKTQRSTPGLNKTIYDSLPSRRYVREAIKYYLQGHQPPKAGSEPKPEPWKMYDPSQVMRTTKQGKKAGFLYYCEQSQLLRQCLEKKTSPIDAGYVPVIFSWIIEQITPQPNVKRFRALPILRVHSI
jgi:hypothetical protein